MGQHHQAARHHPGLIRSSVANEVDAPERLDHISALKSIGLHPLKGNRRGQWATTVNGPWRICFRFKDGDAYEVEIVDYH